MANYCIFIIVWSAWALLGTASLVALLLGKAFRVPVQPAAIPSAESADAAPSTHVLDYATVTTQRFSVVRKWPWLAGVVAFIEAAACLSIVMAPSIMAWTMTSTLRQHAYAAIAVSAVAMVGVCVVVCYGLRRTAGIPAAATWPRRKLSIYLACGLLVCGLTLFMLDMGTKSRLQRLRDQMNAQSQSLQIAVPKGTLNAADIYRQAFALSRDIPDWSSRYTAYAGTPSAPPALSTDLEKAVAILQHAAQLPVADWGIDPKSCTALTNLPHVGQLRSAASLLHIHAAREAQAGRIDSAIRDIHALRAIARHAGQGQMWVEALIALEIDKLADAATELVLPFVNDPQLLDQLIVQPDGWHLKLRSRMVRGEQAASLRLMANVYDGWVFGLIPQGAATSGTSFGVIRTFVADVDATILRSFFDDFAVAAEQEPQQALVGIRRLGSQRPMREQNGSPFLAMFMPAASAAAGNIEAELLERLNTVGVASRRMYLQTGRLPATPDELVSAGFLDRVPTDPFSGKPILLKAKDAEIILYSVGSNGRDDGGDTVRGRDVTFRVATRPLWEIDLAAARQAQQAKTRGDVRMPPMMPPMFDGPSAATQPSQE